MKNQEILKKKSKIKIKSLKIIQTIIFLINRITKIKIYNKIVVIKVIKKIFQIMKNKKSMMFNFSKQITIIIYNNKN